MNELASAPEPRLDAPGAGLPAVELLIARVAFGFSRALTSREKALRTFEAEADWMLRIVEEMPVAEAAEPRLIPRIFGIEDSSRFWSVFMTLEHLVIVDSAIIRVLQRLTQGLTIPGVVSTAAVKPERIADPEVVGRFRDVIAKYKEEVAKLGSLKTQVTHAHPWFGEMNAHGWHCLAAGHHRIHRRQIEAIVRAARG